MSVEVEVKGLDEVKDLFKRFTDERCREGAMARALALIGVEADKIVPIDTGLLKNTAERFITGDKGEIIWDTEYAEYVHEGTRNQDSQPWADLAIQAEGEKALNAYANYLINCADG